MQAIYLRESAIRPETLDGPARSGYTESGKGETPMDVEVKRQPERTELRVEILAPEGDCPQLQRLLAFLSAEDPAVPAQREGERRCLLPEDILRLYGEDKAVRAQTADGVYTVPLRLYELEERLKPFRFVRISHSEIVNLNRVQSLDLKLSGTVRLTLTGGTVCYASRRYVKRIREALNI